MLSYYPLVYVYKLQSIISFFGTDNKIPIYDFTFLRTKHSKSGGKGGSSRDLDRLGVSFVRGGVVACGFRPRTIDVDTCAARQVTAHVDV